MRCIYLPVEANLCTERKDIYVLVHMIRFINVRDRQCPISISRRKHSDALRDRECAISISRRKRSDPLKEKHIYALVHMICFVNARDMECAISISQQK